MCLSVGSKSNDLWIYICGEDDKGVDNVIMGRKCPAPFLFEDKQKNRAKCGDGIVVLSTTRQGSLWIKVLIV